MINVRRNEMSEILIFVLALVVYILVICISLLGFFFTIYMSKEFFGKLVSDVWEICGTILTVAFWILIAKPIFVIPLYEIQIGISAFTIMLLIFFVIGFLLLLVTGLAYLTLRIISPEVIKSGIIWNAKS
jgi:hypothetical protein